MSSISKDGEEERYCSHCEKDTMHTYHDSNHERDSSRDWQVCHECGWRYSGLTGKTEPPTGKVDTQ